MRCGEASYGLGLARGSLRRRRCGGGELGYGELVGKKERKGKLENGSGGQVSSEVLALLAVEAERGGPDEQGGHGELAVRREQRARRRSLQGGR